MRSLIRRRSDAHRPGLRGLRAARQHPPPRRRGTPHDRVPDQAAAAARVHLQPIRRLRDGAGDEGAGVLRGVRPRAGEEACARDDHRDGGVHSPRRASHQGGCGAVRGARGALPAAARGRGREGARRAALPGHQHGRHGPEARVLQAHRPLWRLDHVPGAAVAAGEGDPRALPPGGCQGGHGAARAAQAADRGRVQQRRRRDDAEIRPSWREWRFWPEWARRQLGRRSPLGTSSCPPTRSCYPTGPTAAQAHGLPGRLGAGRHHEGQGGVLDEPRGVQGEGVARCARQARPLNDRVRPAPPKRCRSRVATRHVGLCGFRI
mmetsp:Transcript_4753/g.13922  ORF Transcript_4753/g.13922 Transcript_4753/m.13922 type:complete len:320 (+) Transcript_4753:622-1581(+)